MGMVRDSAGSIYIASTKTVYYPRTFEHLAYYTNSAWVEKLNPDGKTTRYRVEFLNTSAKTVAVDESGNVYLAGAGQPPASKGAFQTEGGGAFLAKLGPDGATLWIGYLSANPTALATDSHGNVYVAGTASTDFRPTSGALKQRISDSNCVDSQNRNIPCTDAFVMKVKSDGSAVVFATLLGGSWEETVAAISVDPSGATWITGETLSPDFPVTDGAFQPTYGGTTLDVYGGGYPGRIDRRGHGYVARLSQDGDSLRFATFAGGTKPDKGAGLAIDHEGNALITGTTESSDFPVTPNASQPIFGGGSDVFLLKLDPVGKPLLSTYVGGPDFETGGAVVVSRSGSVYFLSLTGVPNLSTGGLRILQKCDPMITIVRVDASNGNVLERQGVNGSDSAVFAPSLADAGVDRVSLLAANRDLWVWDPFPLTSDNTVSAGPARLSVYDFSRPASPRVACLANAATFAPGYLGPQVAPGEIISIVGTGLGPVNGVSTDLTGITQLPTELAGTVVKLGGKPVGLLYVQEKQINAIVPFSISGFSTVLTIERGSNTMGPYRVDIVNSDIGIFTTGPSGTGQAVVFNEDGSMNSEDNPAGRETVITILVNGFGMLSPTPADFSIAPIDGVPMQGLFKSSFLTLAEASGHYGYTALGLFSVTAIPGHLSSITAVRGWIPPTAITGRVGVGPYFGWVPNAAYLYIK